LWAFVARMRGRLFESRGLWRFSLYMGSSGLVAILAGWFTTEIGRQPWIVYNVMRTADAVTPHGALEVGITLALFVVVYFVLFGAGTLYILALIRKGPVLMAMDGPPEGGPGEPNTPSRPLSAAPDSDESHEQVSINRG